MPASSAVVALGLLGEFVAIGTHDPVAAVLLLVGALLLGVTMLVGAYLAAGAAVGPLVTLVASGRGHPPRGR